MASEFIDKYNTTKCHLLMNEDDMYTQRRR